MNSHNHEFIGGCCIVEDCGVFVMYYSDVEFDELGRPILVGGL
jgi:hypothetical protein